MGKIILLIFLVLYPYSGFTCNKQFYIKEEIYQKNKKSISKLNFEFVPKIADMSKITEKAQEGVLIIFDHEVLLKSGENEKREGDINFKEVNYLKECQEKGAELVAIQYWTSLNNLESLREKYDIPLFMKSQKDILLYQHKNNKFILKNGVLSPETLFVDRESLHENFFANGIRSFFSWYEKNNANITDIIFLTSSPSMLLSLKEKFFPTKIQLFFMDNKALSPEILHKEVLKNPLFYLEPYKDSPCVKEVMFGKKEALINLFASDPFQFSENMKLTFHSYKDHFKKPLTLESYLTPFDLRNLGRNIRRSNNNSALLRTYNLGSNCDDYLFFTHNLRMIYNEDCWERVECYARQVSLKGLKLEAYLPILKELVLLQENEREDYIKSVNSFEKYNQFYNQHFLDKRFGQFLTNLHSIDKNQRKKALALSIESIGELKESIPIFNMNDKSFFWAENKDKGLYLCYALEILKYFVTLPDSLTDFKEKFEYSLGDAITIYYRKQSYVFEEKISLKDILKEETAPELLFLLIYYVPIFNKKTGDVFSKLFIKNPPSSPQSIKFFDDLLKRTGDIYSLCNNPTSKTFPNLLNIMRKIKNDEKYKGNISLQIKQLLSQFVENNEIFIIKKTLEEKKENHSSNLFLETVKLFTKLPREKQNFVLSILNTCNVPATNHKLLNDYIRQFDNFSLQYFQQKKNEEIPFNLLLLPVKDTLNTTDKIINFLQTASSQKLQFGSQSFSYKLNYSSFEDVDVKLCHPKNNWKNSSLAPIKFLIDTGCTTTSINEEVAKNLGIPFESEGEEIECITANGKAKSKRFNGWSLTFIQNKNEKTFNDVVIDVMIERGRSKNNSPDNLLGLNVLKKFSLWIFSSDKIFFHI